MPDVKRALWMLAGGQSSGSGSKPLPNRKSAGSAPPRNSIVTIGGDRLVPEGNVGEHLLHRPAGWKQSSEVDRIDGSAKRPPGFVDLREEPDSAVAGHDRKCTRAVPHDPPALGSGRRESTTGKGQSTIAPDVSAHRDPHR